MENSAIDSQVHRKPRGGDRATYLSVWLFQNKTCKTQFNFQTWRHRWHAGFWATKGTKEWASLTAINAPAVRKGWEDPLCNCNWAIGFLRLPVGIIHCGVSTLSYEHCALYGSMYIKNWNDMEISMAVAQRWHTNSWNILCLKTIV